MTTPKPTYLRLSDMATRALQDLCAKSEHPTPAVVLYISSGDFPIDGDFTRALAQGAPDHEVLRLATEHANRLSDNSFRLVVECVSRSAISDEFIVEINGIPINAPIDATRPMKTGLLLDHTQGGFVLLDDSGTNVLTQLPKF